MAALVLVAVAVVGALVWWQWEEVAEWLGIADDAGSAGPEFGVNLSEVADNPDALYGHRVEVSAQVDEVLTPHAVTIGNDELVVGDEVLVVSASPLGDLPPEVQVTGVVERYDPEALGDELGIDLRQVDYSGDAAIVASRITQAPPPTVPGDTEDVGPSAGPEHEVSIDEVLQRTDDLIGQQVTVSGEIERLVAPNAIRFGDAMLLAVGPMPEEPFVEAMAQVTGTVARFDLARAEAELGMDLDDTLADLAGEPVILVEHLDVVR